MTYEEQLVHVGYGEINKFRVTLGVTIIQIKKGERCVQNQSKN